MNEQMQMAQQDAPSTRNLTIIWEDERQALDQETERLERWNSELIELIHRRNALITELADALESSAGREKDWVIQTNELKRCHPTKAPALWRDELGLVQKAREAVRWSTETCVAKNRLITELAEFVDRQAEDEGLWFIAQTAPEAYLQQELRKLHAFIEDQAREVVK